MARLSALIFQQSQERFEKLALVTDEVMQCGISLAEDLVVSCVGSLMTQVCCFSRAIVHDYTYTLSRKKGFWSYNFYIGLQNGSKLDMS